MSLNFDARLVDDWELLREDPTTQTLIFCTMLVQMGDLRSEKNIREFASRIESYERAIGTLHGLDPIPRATILKLHGLKTNVANTTRAKWTKRLGTMLMERVDRDHQND